MILDTRFVATFGVHGTTNSGNFDPTNESAHSWSNAHSYNFKIRVKSIQQIKSILIGWEKTNDLAFSLSSFLYPGSL